MSRLIYKIADGDAWAVAERTGRFAGSPDDLRDGFIHFSTAAQLAETARKHFSGRQNLLLVAVDPNQLGEALKWEPSRGGDLFPHLYADLQTRAATWIRPLPLDATGVPVISRVLKEDER